MVFLSLENALKDELVYIFSISAHFGMREGSSILLHKS